VDVGDLLRQIPRGTIKKIADGDALTMPATIDDPAILDDIGEALKGHGARTLRRYFALITLR